MNSGNQRDLYEFLLDEDSEPQDQKTEYKVVLKGIDEARYETKSAFAIKYSLLAKVPVTRTKLLINNAPSVIWKGYGKIKAKKHLLMVEESGGIGEIVKEKIETEHQEDDAKTAEGKKLCSQCGFPLGKDDKFCSFCATPVAGIPSKRNIKTSTIKKTKSSITKGIMIFYLIAVIVLILLVVLSN